MNSRKLLLLAAGILVITIYFKLDFYNSWMDERILAFNEEIYDHMDRMSYEERKKIRWGGIYTASTGIREHIKSLKIKDPLILLPPPSYYQRFGQSISIPEPVVFYYYSGIKTTTVDAKDKYKANCCIIFEGKNFVFEKLKDSADVARVLNIYKSVAK